MRRHIPLLCALLGALLLAGPAAATSKREAERLAEYERYAGEPVKDMPFWRMQNYESLGDNAVVVWTSVSKAWLIKVLPPCSELQWAHAIGLTSTLHRVSAKFDRVIAGRDRCFIASIQPVDYKALRAERKRSRE